ncbi:hypothetical protein Bbelb_103630 [Branchiostoma belcheri]|nr:hypothetical protein Bbelb_103630 [Branchiostoma belcheri]
MATLPHKPLIMDACLADLARRRCFRPSFPGAEEVRPEDDKGSCCSHNPNVTPMLIAGSSRRERHHEYLVFHHDAPRPGPSSSSVCLYHVPDRMRSFLTRRLIEISAWAGDGLAWLPVQCGESSEVSWVSSADVLWLQIISSTFRRSKARAGHRKLKCQLAGPFYVGSCMWRNGIVFGSDPRGPGFGSCRMPPILCRWKKTIIEKHASEYRWPPEFGQRQGKLTGRLQQLGWALRTHTSRRCVVQGAHTPPLLATRSDGNAHWLRETAQHHRRITYGPTHTRPTRQCHPGRHNGDKHTHAVILQMNHSGVADNTQLSTSTPGYLGSGAACLPFSPANVWPWYGIKTFQVNCSLSTNLSRVFEPVPRRPVVLRQLTRGFYRTCRRWKELIGINVASDAATGPFAALKPLWRVPIPRKLGQAPQKCYI